MTLPRRGNKGIGAHAFSDGSGFSLCVLELTLNILFKNQAKTATELARSLR